MSLLSKLLGMSRSELKSTVQSLDTSAVKGRGLRRRFERIRNKQGGFTLLELLVVVAIMAAIASTATFFLHDTDRRAAAGAHVAMMDQLTRGILQYQKLHNGRLPNNWDSLLVSDDGVSFTGAAPLKILSPDLYAGDPANPANIDLPATAFVAAELNAIAQSLYDSGITRVRVVNVAATDSEWGNSIGTTPVALTCANDTTSFEDGGAGIRAVIESKSNDVTPQNIYRPLAANGCGGASHVPLGTATAGVVTADPLWKPLIWRGSPLRVGVAVDAAAPTLVAFGVGPDSTLFDAARTGSLSAPPIYRHVDYYEYNRFIVLFNVSNGPATLQAIIDGAGDTKDEELGELDGVRPT
jgi:prepilin-type N-terminal cleavage/methylation domain-containing protein